MNVVETMFFDNNKLLIDKPRKRQTYQMIGGKIEDGEARLQLQLENAMKNLEKMRYLMKITLN